jgi:hypothetical protein
LTPSSAAKVERLYIEEEMTAMEKPICVAYLLITLFGLSVCMADSDRDKTMSQAPEQAAIFQQQMKLNNVSSVSV